MQKVNAHRQPSLRTAAIFMGLLLALYTAALFVAERNVGRSSDQSAFQKLLAASGSEIDWVVLGASHALPLEYGDVPGRLKSETGQSMLVLAEVGAGPLYMDFVLQQARRDIAMHHVLYVLDDFAFLSAEWNEERVEDRKLLRLTPLRVATTGALSGLVAGAGVDARALADYLTGFSKLNHPDRFPQSGWRGAENFDRTYRPSRHAVRSRIDYLYPARFDQDAAQRYLEIFAASIRQLQKAGVNVSVIRTSLPESFRAAMPDTRELEEMLKERLTDLGVEQHDFRAALGDPRFYFDTDHLNRAGVDTFYEDHLRAILAR